MAGWMNRWLDGWMDEWLNGWMDEKMGGCRRLETVMRGRGAWM